MAFCVNAANSILVRLGSNTRWRSKAGPFQIALDSSFVSNSNGAVHELGQSRRAAVSAIPSNQRRVPLSQRSQAEIPRLHDIDVTVTVASITDSQGQPVSLKQQVPGGTTPVFKSFNYNVDRGPTFFEQSLIALFGPSDPQSLGADQEAYAFAINGGQGAPFKVTYTYGPVGTTSYAAPLTFEGEGVVVTVTTYAAVVDGVPVTLQTTPYPAVGPESGFSFNFPIVASHCAS